MRFSYKGIDKLGKSVSGELDAQDLDTAKAKLKSLDILFNSLKPESKFTFNFSSKTISDKDLSYFLKDLAIYLKSGVSIASAIKLCRTQYENQKKIFQFLNSVYQMILEGSGFYNALRRQSDIALPNFVTQTLKVAEERGFLYEACLELSNFLKKRAELEASAKKAAAYPAFIVTVSVLLIGVMLTVVTPTMAEIFDSNHQELPRITRIVLSVSNFFGEYKIALLLGALLILLGYLYKSKTSFTFRYKLDSMLIKLPIIGRIIQTNQLSRFLYVTAMLTRSGVPLALSVRLSADAVDNEKLKEILVNASDKVVQGARFSSTLSKEPILDRSFVQALYLGEESGQTIEAFTALSQKYQEENKDKTDVALALLEPILMVVVGAIVGVIVAAMLLPIVSISIG